MRGSDGSHSKPDRARGHGRGCLNFRLKTELFNFVLDWLLTSDLIIIDQRTTWIVSKMRDAGAVSQAESVPHERLISTLEPQFEGPHEVRHVKSSNTKLRFSMQSAMVIS